MTSKCISGVSPRFQQLQDFIDTRDGIEEPGGKEAVLIAVLHEAQAIFGCLPPPVQEFIADRLQIPPGKVFGVISFYNHFTTEPLGEFQVNLCMGTACFVRGAEKILEELQSALGIDLGEVTEDGKFSLAKLRCVGACSRAPVMMINDRVYENVAPSQVNDILAEYK